MSKRQKILTTALWAAVVVSMVGIVVIWATRSNVNSDDAAIDVRTVGPAESKFEPLYDAPEFQLTDQNAKSFSKNDLAGKVWIANFIFTHCAGPCPIMSGKMAALQSAIGNKDVRFVSFSVDPERDTPAVLKEYANRYGADDSRWTFVTGPLEEMQAAVKKMNIAAVKETDQSVTHGEQFLLVDRAGRVCGIYRKDDESQKKLIADAMALAAK